MKTRLIFKKDFKQISNIWKKSLSDDVFSILGEKIILLYLELFIKDKKNFGFVIEKNRKILAFLLYGKNEKIIKGIIKKQFFYIILKPILLLKDFKMKEIVIFFEVMIFFVLSRFKNILDDIDTELLYICVKKNKIGLGLGKKIIKDSFKIKKIFFKNNVIKVKTLKKTSENILFYKKLKFKIKKIFFGRVFLVI